MFKEFDRTAFKNKLVGTTLGGKVVRVGIVLTAATLSGCLKSPDTITSIPENKAPITAVFLPTATKDNEGTLIAEIGTQSAMILNISTDYAKLRATASAPAPESTKAPLTGGSEAEEIKNEAAIESTVESTIDTQKRTESNAATTVALAADSQVQPTATPEEEPVISQELTLNTFRDGAKTESQVWQNVIGSLETDSVKEQTLMPSSAELPSNSNAMFTTLSNQPAMDGGGKIDFSKTFGPDPKTEPGLWYTHLDFTNLRDIAIDGSTKILDLIRTNEHGLKTGGFYAESNNRDVAVYFAASLIVAAKIPEDFKDVTIDDLKNSDYPEKYDEEISQVEDEIFAQIQQEFLGESQAEKNRRLSGNDLSGEIPEENRRDDQFNSCDVYKKEDGMQTTRLVIQEDDPTNHNTFTEGNVGGAGSLIAFSEDADGKWGVRAMSDRAYTTAGYGAEEAYPKDAAGEQELNCAEEVAATETLTPTIIVTPTAVFTIPNSFTPFPTPTLTPTKEATATATNEIITPMPTNTHTPPTATQGIPTREATATDVDTPFPTATRVPDTSTPLPTATRIPDTVTPFPTSTNVPPTATLFVSTSTELPPTPQPTNTHTPPTATEGQAPTKEATATDVAMSNAIIFG